MGNCPIEPDATISANDATPGNGTHTARIYVDGNLIPSSFNVTAGNGNDIAYDADGVLHIAYYDSITHTLQYVTRATNQVLSSPQQKTMDGHQIGLHATVRRRIRAKEEYFHSKSFI